MTRFFPRFPAARTGILVLSLLAVGACSEGGDFALLTRNADADGPAPIGATRLIERDVEAPEVFETAGEGLWDGRPSLGGVWVAHPDAEDPERVIIRNEENGRFVIGALFRRDADGGGPDIQISSDAASALEIAAGDPTLIQVTALRREEVAEDAEETTAAEVETAAAVATPDFAAAPLAPIAGLAASAIAETEARAPDPAPASATALERLYVQIGIFSVEQNATNTGQALRGAGLEPTIYDQTSNGQRFWRVVVGPAADARERDATLETARGLGFEDAYFVRR